MAVADRSGLPVAVCIESASPHEVKLVEPTLVEMVVPEAPQNLIGDNAYDSDKLDAELKLYGIEVIAPHRRNRKNKTQDGRRGGTADAGRSRDYLLGCRTSADLWSATSATLRTSSECYISVVV